MWWMIGAALAGNFFEPTPIRGAMRTELSGQTYRVGETWLSGANLSMAVRQERFVFGGDMRLLDDPIASDHWDLHAANFLFGWQAARSRALIVMPYLRLGTHLQPGVSATLRVPIGPHHLVLDASGGPTWELPNNAVSPPVRGIDSEPGAPEAGAALRLGLPARPTARIGLLGDYLATSLTIGKQFKLSAGVTWQPGGPVGLGFLSLRVRA